MEENPVQERVPLRRRRSSVRPAGWWTVADARSLVLRPLLFAGAGIALTARPALAHVKWFTRFSFADEPRAVADLLDPVFLGLVVLSFVTIGALVPLDRFLGRWSAYQRVPSIPCSSPVVRWRITVRRGAGPAARARPISRTATTPEASSSAPLLMESP